MAKTHTRRDDAARNITVVRRKSKMKKVTAEKQVEAERRAKKFRQIRGQSRKFGRNPERHRSTPRKMLRQFCGSVRPVAIPSLAERYWTRMAMRFDQSKTQSSL